jgi:signal transduction histidine kinase
MLFDNLSFLAPIISGVSILVVGVVAMLYDWKAIQAKVFGVFSIVMASWSLVSAYMFAQCGNPEYALFLDRVIYMFVSAIPATIFHFSSTYSEGVKKNNIVIIFGYLFMILFWVLTWSPLFVDGLHQFSNGCHLKAQILHHFFLVYFVGYAVGTLINTYNLFKFAKPGERKRQYKFVFFALLTQTIIGTSAFLPAYGFNILSFSYFSGLITAFILMYAMFRHNLFELKVVAIKLFITLVSIATLVQIVVSDTPTLKIVNVFVFIIVIGLGFLVVQNVHEEIESREKGERLARYLANANARLRQLDKQKTEFVSIASHQLRSPIAAIKGYAALILDGSYGKVPKHITEPLRRIFESGQRISVMVDDFLNVTRIEQGRMSYDMQPHNVCTLIHDVTQELRVVAEEKNLKLKVLCNESDNLQIKADEGKIKQILSNLIDNAIKYTKEGRIEVSAKRIEPGHNIIVQIKDTGIGIAPDEVKNLFQKFNRASNANQTNVLGTGLGLYIAKEILKAHDGWVGVESPGLGKGSTFTVELPFYETNAEKRIRLAKQ